MLLDNPAMNRADALSLLKEYVQSDSLIRHSLAVEACMRHYATLLNGNPEIWGLIGLLHDFDYERFPEPPAHTREGAKILREQNVSEEVIGAILSHADWNLADYPRDQLARKALFAVDELSGFVTAVAFVRPERMRGLKAKSVKKKMKAKGFAAAVSRDDILEGAELIGMDLDQHISQVIEALLASEETLGLTPPS